MPGQVAREVVRERYERLVALQDEISLEENRRLVGATVQVLVAAGEGRKDGATGRVSGRCRDGRLVHLAVDPAAPPPRPGDLVTTAVTYGAPHHLVADGPPLAHRRTRAGDAHEAGTRPGGAGVLLGLPTVGAPRP
jgi:tRNA-2-methylthio-N6-dimethylallyladenosine synthase